MIPYLKMISVCGKKIMWSEKVDLKFVLNTEKLCASKNEKKLIKCTRTCFQLLLFNALKFLTVTKHEHQVNMFSVQINCEV